MENDNIEELTFENVSEDHVDTETTSTEEKSNEEEGQQEGGGDKKEQSDNPGEAEAEQKSEEDDDGKSAEEDTSEKGVILKAGDKHHEIPPDATARVRVNGKNELIPLSELMANYSGKVAYDEKFSQLNEEKEKFQAQESGLKQELEQIGQLMNGDNPLDAALYLAKLAGHDPVDFRTQIMDNLSEEISGLLEMSETERELHLIKTGKSITERLGQVASKAKEKQTSPDANVDQLVRVAGITKEQYEQSLQFLKDEKLDTKPESVIGHAKLAPFVDQAIDYLKPYEESLGEDDLNNMTGLLAQELQRTGGGNHEAAIAKVADGMGYEIAEKEEASPKKEEPPKTKKKEEPKGEDITFDDHF